MPRGDGRLTHDLDPQDKGPQDACGVFGVWAPGEDVAKLTYFGLYALQHRGQESAGIAVSNGRQILVYKDMGLVSQVFDESTLESLKGHLAVGHAATPPPAPAPGRTPSRPSGPTATGSIALGHNGNLTNTRELRELVDDLRRADGELDARGTPARGARPTTPPWSPRCSPHHPDTHARGSAPLEVLPAAARRLLASSSWTSTRCTPPATRRASARWSSAGSSAAGWSPARPRRSTSSAPRSSARSSPAS